MTKQEKGVLILGFTIFSFLPIWRCVGGSPGMNLWEYAGIAFLRSPGSYPHIPSEEAIENARRAYCQVKGLDYEEVYDSYPISHRVGANIPCGVG